MKESGSDDNGTVVEDHLLDDEQFVTLMEAEYSSQAAMPDEVNKKRVWENLQQNLSKQAKRQYGFRHWIPLAAAAIAVMVLVPLWFGQQPLERIKGREGLSPLPLSPLLLADGKTRAVPERVSAGDTLIFKYTSGRAAAAALLLAKQNQSVHVRFSTPRLQAGSDRLLQEKDRSYGYMVEPGDRMLRFCLVAAPDGTSLPRLLAQARQQWRRLPAESCAQIMVGP